MLNADELKTLHRELFKAEPAVFVAPGRVNLIGEHTDYAEGFVFPAAIDLATMVSVSPREDNSAVLYSQNFKSESVFALDEIPARGTGRWEDYPLGVLTVLRQGGIEVPGFSMGISGDVPLGAGLSSSASIEVAAMLALLHLADESFPLPEVARLCQRAENQYVGAPVGIMDQFVSACGQEDHALLLDCRTLAYRLAPIPHDMSLVIANTMVKHSHAEGAYRVRRAEVAEGTRILEEFRPGILALRDVTLEELEQVKAKMPENVYRRCRHIISDSLRAVATAEALDAGNLAEVGRLMHDAHVSYRDDFEASCPEADVMVELAWKQPDCIGARLTGGGFGGCTINLVPNEASEKFIETLRKGYREATGITPDIYRCHASAGAHRV